MSTTESAFGRRAAPRSLLELAQRQAQATPERFAYTFLSDDGSRTTLTFAQLDRQARAIGARLQQVMQPGDRALLIYPAGLDFITAFFGCVYAGVLAVPATYPKLRRPMPRLRAIAEDCKATVALTASKTLAMLDLSSNGGQFQQLRWIATDEVSEDAASCWRATEVGDDNLAFLQYTSGSTSEPKGVMVSHGNLLHNLEMIRQGFQIELIAADDPPRAGVFWLPAYHDMGLIGGILEPLYVGEHSVLLSPGSFLQRPLRWLKAISDYKAVVSGGPNFGYDIAARKTTPRQRAQLDLSSWQVAFCGAEPIRNETLHRFVEAMAPAGFSPKAFYPCYGLAEATLLAAGGSGPSRPVVKKVQRTALARHQVVSANGQDDGQSQELVGCGQALLEQEIVIADLNTSRRLEPDRVGEIWISGPNVARGYWNRTEENKRVFRARLDGDDERTYLRTGDLGFISEGNLYVTGRVKDVIIIRGRNHYPQDIELTAENSHPALLPHAGAAFTIELQRQERLVIIHEIDHHHRHDNFQEIIRGIRRNVAEEHELDVHAVTLIRQASLPRTTSGKPQRSLCREQFQEGGFRVMAEWIKENGAAKRSAAGRQTHSAADKASVALENRPQTEEEIQRLAERIESWLLDWLVERAGVPAEEIDRDKPFAEYGLDSLTAVELSQELEDWLDVRLTPVVAWNYPTPVAMSRYLAGEAGGGGPAGDGGQGEEADLDNENQFDQLLAQIETLSDSEAEEALRDER